MFKTFFFLFFFCCSVALPAAGQVLESIDTPVTAEVPRYRVIRDSAYLARQKIVNDSLIAHALINPSMRSPGSPLIDSLLAANAHPELTPLNFAQVFSHQNKNINPRKQGRYLPKGEAWGLSVIAFFLALFALLRYSFSRQLQTIVQSFYNNRVLANLNKEDSLFTSWPFLLLFILFGFVIGMFYYLVTQYYQQAGGFRYFIIISTLIVVLYAAKILILKVFGHFFNIGKAINEYITILFLSYFNAGLLFLPMVVAFALSPLKNGIYFIVASYIILILIIGIQLIRAGIIIMSGYRFSKLYLLLYFCALEFCPIIILIKTVG